MRTLRALWCRVVGVLRPTASDADFDAEVESHLELHVDEGVRAGLSVQEARRQAILALGGVERTREARRDRRGLPFIETLRKDVTYAFRLLRRDWGWTVVAVLSLGLGIGANTALFGAAHRTLLATLAVPRPSELVALHWHGDNPAAVHSSSYGFRSIAPQTQTWAGSFSYVAFDLLRARTATLSDLFAFAPAALPVTVNGEAETPRMQFVSGNYYTGLGVVPVLGRLLDSADENRANPVVVISQEYWSSKFSGDPATIGSAINVKGRAFTIVGVAPSGIGDLFRPGGRSFDMSLPLTTEPLLQGEASRVRSSADWWLLVMGRRAPGAAIAQVEADLGPVFKEIAGTRDQPRVDRGPSTLVVRSGERGTYDLRPEVAMSMALLAAIFGALLVIVAVNLANLTLVRSATRQRELALRAAVGASRGRLIRQLTTESLLVAALGGTVALGLAAGSMRALRVVFPELGPFVLDPRVLVFAAATSLLTAVLFGLFPALRTVRASTGAATRAVGRQTDRTWLSRSLIVAQVAVSLVLLVCAGLFVRTLVNLKGTPTGFNPENLVFFRLDTEQLNASPERLATLQREILDRLRSLPGVNAAALASQSLLTGSSSTTSGTLADGTLVDSVVSIIAGTDYFDTMAIPLKGGRAFVDADYDGPPVAVVNEAFVRRWLDGRDPVGQTFEAGYLSSDPVRIVGIVADTKYARVKDPAPPAIYTAPRRGGRPTPVFHLRTAPSPADMTTAIRNAVAQVGPELPEVSLSIQTEVMAREYAREETFAAATSLFGGLALLVSMIGLYGVMSYAVVRRTKEIGIRMALGAQAAQVLWAIVQEALLLVAVGAGVGVAVAVATTRFLSGFLYELSPTDPLAIASAVVIVLGVAALAGLLPARAASRVDPVVALRQE